MPRNTTALTNKNTYFVPSTNTGISASIYVKTGTYNELLSSEPAPVSGYGLSYYSNFRQTHLLSDKEMLELNKKMERDNINLEDIFDRKYREKKDKKNKK
jgi:hypothetical protein